MWSITGVIRRAIQLYGTPALKRKQWNREFRRGRWDCLENTEGDPLYPILERHSKNKRILDLGSGSGSTASESAGYAYYLGLDISDAASMKATDRVKEKRRPAQFETADIFTYVPNQQFDVILLRDSIYYIPDGKIIPMLQRYTGFLAPGGVFIVRMFSYRPILETITKEFHVVEKYSDSATILVFTNVASNDRKAIELSTATD
jgi:SAM-dependent methyltransferase